MRFFKPSIASWKYREEPEVKDLISREEKYNTIRQNVKFFDWQLSFTKTCVQIAFIIFVIANLFILTIMTINFIINNSIEMLEGYTNNVFAMFENVIGGYIIKSATENALKIVMSVMSDYVERKYGSALLSKDTLDNPEEFCESGIDTDTYDDLINNELNPSNISDEDNDDTSFEGRDNFTSED
jgi:hypothetical protein